MNSPIIIPYRDRILGGLWGSLVGDALGVPVEFKDRVAVQNDPVVDMRGYGTHHQPPGTWSDDGALILCATESLLQAGYDPQDMGDRFVQWMYHGLWTAWGDAFDVGCATSDALMRIANGCPAKEAGSQDEYSNGNGSLMRIIPAVLHFIDLPLTSFADRLEIMSAITHGHPRSKMACVLYGLVIRQLLLGQYPPSAWKVAQLEFTSHYQNCASYSHFDRIFHNDLSALREREIASTGYVLHTLHASLWCLLSTSNYEACVLKAVNLGGDTDTTGCVAGGLAGVYYGLDAIPKRWLHTMARFNDVDSLLQQFTDTTPVIS